MMIENPLCLLLGNLEKPPPSGWVKVNSDVCGKELESVVESLVRDESRKVLHAYSERVDFVEPSIAEAAGLLASIRTAIDCGHSCAVFEGDCLNVYGGLSTALKDATWDLQRILT
ncbi:hypothetical protein PanWU01x14_338150 [Parasponia andersonii]|uniref:RNase H type-1 domain-containing protein n=1 Tax=Parasponia andersonii TaxID=3476 RepID=A0A2P5AFA5_PARAD|nr:hypothetical protein PanWU01x14_338150 [Parasponia andersonii]